MMTIALKKLFPIKCKNGASSKSREKFSHWGFYENNDTVTAENFLRRFERTKYHPYH